jgi:hypothetical protein
VVPFIPTGYCGRRAATCVDRRVPSTTRLK